MKPPDGFVLPDGFEKWNPAMRGAYVKGAVAASEGKPPSSCPYADKRKDGGRLTWSRSFIAAWHDGWDAWRQQNPLSAYYQDRANSGQSPLEAHR